MIFGINNNDCYVSVMFSIQGKERMVLKLKSFARKVKRRLIQTSIISPRPTSLNVFTTNRCTFSCFYCGRNIKDDAPGVDNRYEDKSDFHFADLRFLLDKYPSIRRVSFVGVGEPFLVQDLLSMARLAKEKGKYVVVVTNGSVLHQFWGRIAPSFDQVSVSLHGLTATELTAISKVSEHVFNQFVDNVRYLVQKEKNLNPSIDVRASVVMLKTNLDRVKRAAIFCAENSVPELDVQNYIPIGLDNYENCVFNNDFEYIRFIDKLIQEFHGSLKINPPVLIKRNDRALSWGCTTFFNTLRVDGLGQVSGCSRIMVPMAKNGNYRNEPDVWQNVYYREMRQRFRAKRNLPDCCRFCPEAQ